MKAWYRILAVQGMLKDEGEDMDIGLIVQFKGRCHNCGEYGHKLMNCPKKGASSQLQQPNASGDAKLGNLNEKQNGSQGKRFLGNCFNCRATHTLVRLGAMKASGADTFWAR